MNRGIYEDMTAAEVAELTKTIPSFQFFYDNIRAKIVAKSDGHERSQYEDITYNDMYDLFNYLGSSDYLEFIESERTAYSEKMSSYQVQIDSISDHFRSIVDNVKVKGGPQFDFAKIFKHPKIYRVIRDGSNIGDLTRFSFMLPIKNQELFSESGIEDLVYRIVFFEKGKPNGPIFSDSFSMKLYDNGKWDDLDAQYVLGSSGSLSLYMYEYPCFMDSYDPQKTIAENFNNIFDWYYVVYPRPGAPIQYEKYLKNKIPSAVYSYWYAQEGSDISMYIDGRNEMINNYIDEHYTPIKIYLPDIIERHILDVYHDQYILYQRVNEIKPQLTEEFDAMIGRITVDLSEWLPAGLQLPIFHPNGNYIRAGVYEEEIFREGVGPEYL